jgi:hypothetical protein
MKSISSKHSRMVTIALLFPTEPLLSWCMRRDPAANARRKRSSVRARCVNAQVDARSGYQRAAAPKLQTATARCLLANAPNIENNLRSIIILPFYPGEGLSFLHRHNRQEETCRLSGAGVPERSATPRRGAVAVASAGRMASVPGTACIQHGSGVVQNTYPFGWWRAWTSELYSHLYMAEGKTATHRRTNQRREQ